jgi:hypothetical protein
VLWEARSSAVRSAADAERQWEPPRVPSQEPVATDTGVVIIIGVMVVVGFARVEGRTPCPRATAGRNADEPRGCETVFRQTI